MPDNSSDKTAAEPIAGSAAEATAVDRRTEQRHAFITTAEVTEQASGVRLPGRTADLGLRGCYIDTLNPFPTGTTVQVRLVRAGKTFESEGVVVYGQPGMGMGIAFTALIPGQLELLTQWLKEVTGELPVSSEAPGEAARTRPILQQKELRILHKLISMMISRRLLSESEGDELLRDLFR